MLKKTIFDGNRGPRADLGPIPFNGQGFLLINKSSLSTAVGDTSEVTSGSLILCRKQADTYPADYQPIIMNTQDGSIQTSMTRWDNASWNTLSDQGATAIIDMMKYMVGPGVWSNIEFYIKQVEGPQPYPSTLVRAIAKHFTFYNFYHSSMAGAPKRGGISAKPTNFTGANGYLKSTGGGTAANYIWLNYMGAGNANAGEYFHQQARDLDAAYPSRRPGLIYSGEAETVAQANYLSSYAGSALEVGYNYLLSKPEMDAIAQNNCSTTKSTFKPKVTPIAPDATKISSPPIAQPKPTPPVSDPPPPPVDEPVVSPSTPPPVDPVESPPHPTGQTNYSFDESIDCSDGTVLIKIGDLITRVADGRITVTNCVTGEKVIDRPYEVPCDNKASNTNVVTPEKCQDLVAQQNDGSQNIPDGPYDICLKGVYLSSMVYVGPDPSVPCPPGSINQQSTTSGTTITSGSASSKTVYSVPISNTTTKQTGGMVIPTNNKQPLDATGALPDPDAPRGIGAWDRNSVVRRADKLILSFTDQIAHQMRGGQVIMENMRTGARVALPFSRTLTFNAPNSQDERAVYLLDRLGNVYSNFVIQK